MDQPEYNKVTTEFIDALKEVCGEENVLYDREQLTAYGRDYTEDLSFPPEVVVKPGRTEEVSRIMQMAHDAMIPVTPIGARTGLSGGCLSVYGGIGMSLERMDRILKIDEDNLQVITEPGVITQVLQEAVAEKGLYYAPDPASRGSCFIGGNIAENSGGPRAVKYGVTKDFVLNLEVVLPDGAIIETGANTLKNSTGYNLTQLMVGSEGTLGVVTKATLKLVPKPSRELLMLVPFSSPEKACEAVSAIFRAGITPSALEFMERDAIEMAMRFTEDTRELPDNEQAHLLIEVDGNDEGALMSEMEAIAGVLERFDAGEMQLAQTAAEKDRLWNLRRKVGEATHSHSVYKEEDTVVPRYRLPELLIAVKEIGNRYGFRSVCYGHAGDGNLHVNILKEDMPDSQWNEQVPKAIRELFTKVVELEGTISGEHGIGLVQKEFMNVRFSDIELDLMRRIKQVFDPKQLLNPGKIC